MFIIPTARSKKISIITLTILMLGGIWAMYSTPSRKAIITICPVKNITGYPCPGCGISRSIVYAVHGDFHNAFKLHPLWVVVLPLLFIIGLYHGISLIINKKLNSDHPQIRKFILGFLIFLIVLFILTGIIRLIFKVMI
ncbi:MAG: DUF2752 domain-containing protein [Spirochaetota bacterium]|nr:DUF2752 domain-containing protein [Spirochaetota bacterium]